MLTTSLRLKSPRSKNSGQDISTPGCFYAQTHLANHQPGGGKFEPPKGGIFRTPLTVNEESRDGGTIDQLIQEIHRYAESATDGQAKPADRAYQVLRDKLIKLRKHDIRSLARVTGLVTTLGLDIDPGGQSISDLRIPEDTQTSIVVSSSSFPFSLFDPMRVSRTATTSYPSQNTFLGSSLNYVPSSSYSIVGIGGLLMGSVLEKGYDLWKFSDFISGSGRTGPDFPPGNDIFALKYGDGIVNIDSQQAIGGPIQYVFRSHAGETQSVNEILSLIDDALVIKHLRIAEAPPFKNAPLQNYYLIFEVEEYLPADLEVSEFTLDGVSFPGNSDLATFLNSEGKYVPYHRFRHDMLKRRLFEVGDDIVIDYNNEPIELAPREFPIEISAIGEGAHSVMITFKNAAGKTILPVPLSLTPLTGAF